MTKPRTRRQSRRHSAYFDPAEDDSSPPPTATGNISINDMAAMMSTWQRNQEETFEKLLHTVLNHSQRSSPPPAQPAHGNFAACKARYSGAPDESLDGFIDAVEAYKECANVSETNALRGLSMLLTHEAATWWQGVKSTMNKWDHALTSLRGAFGDSRPPHRIYKELFANPQQASEKTELFISKTRALLSRLPKDDLTTKVQMDMVYGLLHSKIRERLRREEIDTFDKLLRKSREIEESYDVSLSTSGLQNKLRQRQFPPPSRHAASIAAAQKSTTAPPLPPQSAPKAPAPAAESSAHGTYRRSPRCSVVSPSPSFLQPHGSSTPFANARRRYCFYCKNYGHTRDECRRLTAKGKQDIDNTADPVPSCYGCNERGVTRSQCAKCNSDFSACEHDRPIGALMGNYGTWYSTTVIKSFCDKDESQASSTSSYNSVSHKGFPSSMLSLPESSFDPLNHKSLLISYVRKKEGVMLHPEERLLLSDLLKQNKDLFEQGGGPTPYAEHHIDTGDNAPIAVPPYRLTPAKKEIMKAELEKMLADDVIEECKYHSSDLTPFTQKSDNKQTTPVIPKKGRGRPRIKQSGTKLGPGRVTNLEGEPITQRNSLERALESRQRVSRDAPQSNVIGPRPRRHRKLPPRLRD
ncbi:unnamed protein product, partial [Iphiclides podalirius]